MEDIVLNTEESNYTQNLYNILSKEETSEKERVDTFIELSNFFVDKDFSGSFKYASLATVTTNIPRADACCCLGDRYLMSGEFEWAAIWYNHAMHDSLQENCDSKYWTYLPLRNLAQISFSKGNKEEALNLIEALLIMRPKDDDLKSLKELFLSNK